MPSSGRPDRQVHERVPVAQQPADLLASILAFFVAMWNIVVYVAASGEGDSDFSDAGAAPAQQQQEKQKVVKLMQRQQKAQPKSQQTFRTTAISDITLPT